MSMTKVWNITDARRPGIKPHNRMVLGKSLKPGQALKVDESKLAAATKLKKDEAMGFIHIGKNPPADYLKLKKPARAVAEGRKVDSKGVPIGRKTKAVAKGHARKLVAKVAASSNDGPVAAQPEPAPAMEADQEAPDPSSDVIDVYVGGSKEVVEAPAEEEPEEEVSSYSRRGRRRK